MESIETEEELDLESIKYVPFFDNNTKLNLDVNAFAQEPFDFRTHNYEVIAHEY